MLKKKSKLLALFVIIMLLLSTLCFATSTPADGARTAEPTSEGEATPTIDDGTMPISEDGNTTTPTEGDNQNQGAVAEEDITNNNLVIFDDDIKMDKLVDGNVYLFGNNIEITGKVNGNIFVFGNTVTFSDESYIINSAYVFANTVEFRGLCSDLNVASRSLNIPYSTESCFVFRDLNVVCDSFTFAGGVGRNANVAANNFNFVKDENASGLVYGDLNYTASNELELSTELVNGSINYRKMAESSNKATTQEIIVGKLISLGAALLFAVVVYFLAMLIAPKFANNANAKLFNILPAFGIGILSFIVALLVFIGLMFTVIGVPLGFVLIAIYILLFTIASSVFALYVANALKPLVEKKIKLDKIWKFIIFLLLVTLVLWALQLIPFVGGWIKLIIVLAGVGFVFMSIFGNLKNNFKSAQATNE